MKKILALLISILGFAVSCNKNDDYISPKYGVENSEFSEKQAVVDNVAMEKSMKQIDEEE